MSRRKESRLFSCPFCAFEDKDPDLLLGHVNSLHPDPEDALHVGNRGDKQVPLSGPAPPQESAAEWVECDCGEMCLLIEFPDHIALHEAEDIVPMDFSEDILLDASITKPSVADGSSAAETKMSNSHFGLYPTASQSPDLQSERRVHQQRCEHGPQTHSSRPNKLRSSMILGQSKRLGVSARLLKGIII